MNKSKKAFTLIELLLVLLLILIFSSAIVYNFNTDNNRLKYIEAKNQLKTYILYNKYKAAESQTQNSLSIENKNIYSSIDNEIEWMLNFKDEIKIINYSATNINFYLDGSVDESHIDIISNDGIYSNRLNITPIGTISYTEIINTNNIINSQ